MNKSKINYKNPFCYMLVGPVGVGKSAVREQILQSPTMKDAVIVSTDDLVMNMAIARGKTYEKIFEWLNPVRFKTHVRETVRSAVADNRNILVDRCNLTQRTRSVITNLLPAHYNIIMVVIRYDRDKVIQNVTTNPKYTHKAIPLAHVYHMFKVYQEPERGEYDVLVDQEAIYD